MEPSTNPFLRLFGSLVLLLLCGGIALAVSVQRAGMISVDVEAAGPDGCTVKGLRVPGLLANTAIQALPAHIFDGMKDEAEWVPPLLSRACDALREVPDFNLVEVDGPDELVRIIKRGNDLVIDVVSDDEKVHVVLPIKTLDTVAQRFASR